MTGLNDTYNISTITNTIKSVTDYKLVLHNLAYNNIDCINLLLDLFVKSEYFSPSYNINSKSIVLKIKKSNIKKDSNYNNSSIYYYSIINSIMQTFFKEINTIINIDIPENYIYLLYNLVLIQDSIIIINL